MKFLVPTALAFGAAIPIVIVFYLLKRKRVIRLVSSTLLWQRFLAETQANAPFQRLRHNWLLIFQVLLLLLAVLAIARPFFAGDSKSTQLKVLILDASASMQATDEKPSRFEKARDQALKLVDGLRDGEQAMVVLAGTHTEVRQSRTSDKLALRRAIEGSSPSDSPTRLSEALKTASAFTYEKRGEEEVTSGEIHLFSDGATPPLGELENKNLPLVYHKVGQRGENVGIVSLDVRANPENPSQRAIFTGVYNASSTSKDLNIDLLFNNQLIETRSLNLAPTNTQPLVFLAPQSKDGVFTVRLNVEDDLKADDQASIVSLMPQPVKVLLVTQGNRFLEKALQAVPNVQLRTVSFLRDAASAFDIVVLDDVAPSVWPTGNTLAIHVANTNLFRTWSTISGPPIVDVKTSHPVMRFVNFDNVRIREALEVKATGWGVTILESPKTPLIIAGEQERQRILWIGFDTLQSEWPLRTSFPIFFANAMDWLNPANMNSSQLLVHAGDAFRAGFPNGITSGQMTRPDGTTQKLTLEPNAHEIVYGDTLKQGVYRLKAGTNEVTFCVNLMDSLESNVTPRDDLPLGKYSKVTASALKRSNQELWRWLAGIGLAVLLFEWWFYHRRTA
ncbi:MAG TPA: VWA domain-containing protein [Candidatus Saccharimonadales bacterium]|nr:VWA domain-containing protein [Candidatus Saccharimonadales bacterium]